MSSLPTEGHLTSEVLRLRKEGVFFSEIGSRLGISTAKARYICKCAVRRGSIDVEALGMRPYKPSPTRTGDSEYAKRWIVAVLEKCTVSESGCWIWTGHRTSTGYGQRHFRALDSVRQTRTTIIHREMFQLVHGKKLAKWEYVCHRCDVKLCCNPAHLFLGSPTQNSQDQLLKRRHAEQRVTHCPKGHPYDEVNTYVTPSGSRSCKECNRQRCREAWHNGKAKLRQQRLRASKRLAQEQRA